VLRPARAFATFLDPHRAALNAFYALGEEETMVRMILRSDAQAPSASPFAVRCPSPICRHCTRSTG